MSKTLIQSSRWSRRSRTRKGSLRTSSVLFLRGNSLKMAAPCRTTTSRKRPLFTLCFVSAVVSNLLLYTVPISSMSVCDDAMPRFWVIHSSIDLFSFPFCSLLSFPVFLYTGHAFIKNREEEKRKTMCVIGCGDYWSEWRWIGNWEYDYESSVREEGCEGNVKVNMCLELIRHLFVILSSLFPSASSSLVMCTIMWDMNEKDEAGERTEEEVELVEICERDRRILRGTRRGEEQGVDLDPRGINWHSLNNITTRQEFR